MAHIHDDHSHGISPSRDESLVQGRGKILLIVIVLTTTILIAELVGAYATKSLALLADAGHMLSDAAGLIVAGIAILIGNKSVDKQATYGYRRAEILAAALNAVTVFLIALWILYEAISRIGKPTEVMSSGMFWVALIGLGANIISALLLRKYSEGSLNMKGAYLHVLSDLLGSVGVIIAALVIKFTGWTPADSIASIFIVLMIIPRSWSLLKQTLTILMEGVPEGIDLDEIRDAIGNLKGVDAVHDLHVWSVNGTDLLATMHVVMSPHDDCEDDSLLHSIQEVLEQDFHIEHSTIQLEHHRVEEHLSH